MLLTVACADHQSQGPIATTNAILGDESFVAAFGRAPSAEDDEVTRIRTHLLYVEALLRSRPSAGWSPALAAERRRNLDRLAVYAAAQRFPAGNSPAGRLPTFIDDQGRLCAVARLVAASAGPEAAARLGRHIRNAYVEEIRDPEFVAWAEASGLTRRELAMIQPAYQYRQEPLPADRLNSSLGPTYLRSLDSGSADVGGAQLEMRYLGKSLPVPAKPMLGLAGILGRSKDGLAYAADATLGVVYFPVFDFDPSLGLSAGGRVSALGNVQPRTISAPLAILAGAALPGSLRLQLRGELELVVEGPLRDPSWTAGLDLVKRELFETESSDFRVRDLTLGVAYRAFSRARFLTFTLALGAHALRHEQIW